jgi:predicted molibdopterin-dependent oxidoreductase YjgC
MKGKIAIDYTPRPERLRKPIIARADTAVRSEG